jgi:hypothetical protein
VNKMCKNSYVIEKDLDTVSSLQSFDMKLNFKFSTIHIYIYIMNTFKVILLLFLLQLPQYHFETLRIVTDLLSWH